jgi:hypothetical protein
MITIPSKMGWLQTLTYVCLMEGHYCIWLQFSAVLCGLRRASKTQGYIRHIVYYNSLQSQKKLYDWPAGKFTKLPAFGASHEH